MKTGSWNSYVSEDASEVLRECLLLVERREVDDLAKLEALREAADVGFGALDRAELRQFDSIDDLQAYLIGLSEKLMSGAANDELMSERKWRVRLGAVAELDFANIIVTCHFQRTSGGG
jgi:antitoxin ParD1/3/4